MSERPAMRKEIVFVGVLAAAIGVYFSLVGAGALPVPGGPKNLHAPLWIVLCAGLAFLLAGVAALMQAAGRANEQGELPSGAPQWMWIVQYLTGLAIFVCFGAIASFIAFAPGLRAFSGSMMGVTAPAGAMIGRAAFGIGAIIIWLATIAVAVSGARKLWFGPAGR